MQIQINNKKIGTQIPHDLVTLTAPPGTQQIFNIKCSFNYFTIDQFSPAIYFLYLDSLDYFLQALFLLLSNLYK
jgi:hypothetical protein